MSNIKDDEWSKWFEALRTVKQQYPTPNWAMLEKVKRYGGAPPAYVRPLDPTEMAALGYHDRHEALRQAVQLPDVNMSAPEYQLSCTGWSSQQDDIGSYSELARDTFEFSEKASRDVAPLIPSAHDLSRHLAAALRRARPKLEVPAEPSRLADGMAKRFLRVRLSHESVIAKNVDRCRAALFTAVEKLLPYIIEEHDIVKRDGGTTVLRYIRQPVHYLERYGDNEQSAMPNVAYSHNTDEFVVYLRSYYLVQAV